MASGPPIVTISQLDGNNQPIKATTVEAQFNPASLNISYHAKSAKKAKIKQKGGVETVGEINHRTGIEISLSSVDLIFDTTRTGTDVRAYTLKLANLIHIADKPNQGPRVRFQWGTLLFDGTIDSLSETLEYFSALGVPLRAKVNLKMQLTSEKRSTNSAGDGLSGAAGASAGFSAGFSAGVSASAGISASASVSASASLSASASFSASASASFSASAAVGTTGLTLAQSGESIQAMSARAGLDWKAVASANGIDNPRALQAGAVVNLNASAQAKVTFN